VWFTVPGGLGPLIRSACVRVVGSILRLRSPTKCLGWNHSSGIWTPHSYKIDGEDEINCSSLHVHLSPQVRKCPVSTRSCDP
jgi:hypothetical protein